MKRPLSILATLVALLTLTMASSSYATQLAYEPFAYSPAPGEIVGATGSSWTFISDTTNPLDYVTGSLSYAGLPTSQGNMAQVVGASSADDAELPFTAQNTVYASFLLDVTALPTTQDYPVAIRNGSYQGRIFVIKNGSNFELGLSKGSTTVEVQTAMSLVVGTTYLVATEYDVDIPGSDTFRLWVNPALGSSQPAADITATAGNDSLTQMNSFALRQNSGAGTVNVDEIRVGTSWADVTPLALSSDDPDATFLPSTLAFGVIPKENTKDLSLNVLNDAGSTNNLDITGVNFGGANPGNFSLVTTLPISGIAPGTSTTLTFRYDPAGANGADNSATATLVCNDANPPILILTGKSYLDVADVAAARAAGAGIPLRIAGPVTVNCPTDGLNLGGNRHQLSVQDASGTDGQSGLFIDDPGYGLATNYVVGDQLSNITGTITIYHALLELVPDGPATLAGTGATVTPLVLAGTETLGGIEAELIRVNTISITTADTTWMQGSTSGKNYTLNSAVGPIDTLRVEEGSQIAGQPIAVGNFDAIGISITFDSHGDIEPRFTTDIVSPPSEVPDWPLIK